MVRNGPSTSVPPARVFDLRSVFGLTAEVTTPAETTDGAYVEMDVTVEPGCRTLIHYHPAQEETYRVLEGTLEVFRDGRWHAVPTGGTMEVPRGAIHGFRNTSDAPVRFATPSSTVRTSQSGHRNS